jgi:hypothetical protein
MSDHERKEIVTNIAPETVFWAVIALVLGILLLTGFLYS